MVRIYKYILTIILGLASLVTTAQEEQLETYLQEAGENNPGLQAAFQEYYAALEKIPQAGALPDPQLSFGIFIKPVETRLGPQQSKISVSQMFPWFGTLREQENAFAEKAKVKYQYFLSLKNELYKDVKVKYFELYKMSKAVEIITQNLEVLNSLEKITERNYESGKSEMADVLRLKVDIREQENKLEDLKTQLETLKTDFNLLLNREEQQDVFVPNELRLDTFNINSMRDSIRANPKINAFTHEEKSLQHQYEVAKKKGYPDLSVGLDYVFVGERQDMDVMNSGQNVVMPMVGVSIPINRNKYNSMKKEKQHQLNAVQFNKQERFNRLRAAYKNAEEEYLEGMRNVDLYKKQAEETRRIFKLLETNYSSDGKDFYELLKTRLMVLEYELKLEQAKAAQNIAVAKLEYLTGTYSDSGQPVSQ
ncbi:MAG: TolC family protein [Bacteroidales bacterium]